MRPQLLTIALAAASLAGGCTRVGVPPASPVPLAPVASASDDAGAAGQVAFGGTVVLGGQRLPVFLELTGDERGRRRATLRIPDVPMEASGEGSWSGDHIRLELRYGDGCPGTLAVDATVTERGAEGTLQASDCTGTDAGPLMLVRRSTAAPERSAGR